MKGSEIISLLRNVRKTTSGWIASCPAHDDKNPSLSIKEILNGRDLFHCHAGCSYVDIRNAVEPLELSDSIPGHGSNRSYREKVAEYKYTNEHRQLLFIIERFHVTRSDGSCTKEFRAKQPAPANPTNGSTGWIRNLKGLDLVLYRLPELVQADIVFVVEGEKDVDTLARIGITATCNPFGAGKWRTGFSKWLSGKVSAILPDNDDPGRQHADAIALSLRGVAREVHVIKLPGLPPKGDVTDFIEGGGTGADLLKLLSQSEPWRPTTETEVRQIPRFEFTSLPDLLNEPKEEIDYVWDDTLPTGGFSLLSAKPKVGKSTFARNLAVAVARGEVFVDRPTHEGTVLYLCLEEKRSEITKHFRRMGADSDRILIHTGSTPENVLEELRAAIAQHDPVLVIMDPLSRVLRVSDFNDYGSMSRGLEPFIDLRDRVFHYSAPCSAILEQEVRILHPAPVSGRCDINAFASSVDRSLR